ncbi:MAG: hypothetical protein ABSE20_26800 [Acetobacteraceae bacterium]
MSGTETAGANHPTRAADDSLSLSDQLTFNSDVNEVFLLIDHISGRSEKSLKDLDTTNIELPAAQGAAEPVPAQPDAKDRTSDKPSIADVLHRLCQIGYPPHPDATTKAHKAAFVLMLKDRLNGLAIPARGVTIAYTAMFVSATDGCRLRLWSPQRTPDGRHATRGDLAREAYPGLASHARCFAKMYRWFPYLMAFVLILTASAYWDVGFGRTVVQRIEQLEKSRVDLLHPDTRGTSATVAVDDKSCAAASGLPAEQAQTCVRLSYLTNRIEDSRKDLLDFAIATTAGEQSSTFVRVIAWIRPVSYGFMFDGQAPAADRPEATVASVLSLFSTYVLPAMFGLLGTLAAIMRSIQAKVRDSLLGPRDFPLTALGLVIGPVAGLAVGLFFTPTEATTSGATGLAGSVSLSASGLGFLAGYGADAFFKFVDALLTRVFALEPTSK